MLKHKRLVSIIATIAFCLSFLAPAIIAPAPAMAGYSVIRCPSITVPTVDAGVALGSIAIDVPEMGALTTGDAFTISLPVGVTMPNSSADVASAGVAADVVIDDTVTLDRQFGAPEFGQGSLRAVATSDRTIDVFYLGNAGAKSGAGRIVVHFNKIRVIGVTGDIVAKINPAPNTAWPTAGEVVIAKGATSGTLYPTVSSVKTISSSGGPLDTIILTELIPGTLKPNHVIELTLPNGFNWEGTPYIVGGWGLTNNDSDASNAIPGKADGTDLGETGKTEIKYNVPTNDKRKLEITLTGDFMTSPTAGFAGAGRLSIVGARIGVDDSVARVGDVTIDISSREVDIAPSTLTVAKYADFGVTFEEDNPKEVVAGMREVKVGNIVIKENAAGSLVSNRELRFELPAGVKWARDNDNNTIMPSFTAVSGQTITFETDKPVDVGSDKQIIKAKVKTGTTDNAATLKLSDIRLDISPTFSGDVVVKIGGNQGVTGEVKVATVKSRVSIKTDGEPSKVIIGGQNQALPDILIVENVKEGIRSTDYNTKYQARINVVLPPAVVFTSVPTVEVTEGDLVIDKVGITKSSTDGAIYRGVLTIPIKGASSTPSTIKLSNVRVTVDRTVAEGPLTVALTAPVAFDALDECANQKAVNDTPVRFFNYEAVSATKGAECVTPSVAAGRTVSMWIGSKTIEVNGNYVYMEDAAPYIKNGRTYVPVRYLGDALGATTTWDPETKTVTVTKGDNSVVLVVGSTVAKVNGADVQMDVAPEITPEGRTMLPARWVAEGLGYNVDWIAAQRQVLIFG